MAAMIANLIGFSQHLTHFGKSRFLKRWFSNPNKTRYKLPMPKVPHLILSEDIVGDRKLLFIGDLHGCADELQDLLCVVKSKYDTSEFLPIFVGDLVNKGPKSIETLHAVRHMEHYSVRGNHDESTLRHAIQYRDVKNYVPSARYMPWVCQLSEHDIMYLQELPYTISIPSFNALVVHAGLVPNVPLNEQTVTDMIIMRNLIRKADGSYKSAELANEGDPWGSLWPGPGHIYFGHDAIRKLQKHEFATGLDTGCVYGFDLTAVLVSRDGSKEFFSVKANNVYEIPKLTAK